MNGATHAIRYSTFSPTSCASCTGADGEIVSIEAVINKSIEPHEGGTCTFSFIYPEPRPAPPRPEPEPTDPCASIRNEIRAIEGNRDYQQSLADWYMRELQRRTGFLTNEQIMQYVRGMLAAVANVQEYNERLTELQGNLTSCEAGGNI